MRKSTQLYLYNAFSLIFFPGIAKSQEIKLKVSIKSDSVKIRVLQEVVISASRVSESILKSPVSIENITNKQLKNTASPSFFDGLENVKGVQMLTSSMGFRIINTRGFGNTTNVRFSQLVDGIDNQAPHIGAPIGNTLGPGDMDIDRIEIIPGTAFALYGLNAINGMANIITKNPFDSQGISFQQKTGYNHVGDNGSSAKLFSESSFRVARVISKRWAFKANATYTKGHDWIANNQTDLNADANRGVGLSGRDNPAYDAINGYGNESSNRRTITLQGKQYVVSRTGYDEKDVTDYNIENVKADLGVFYRPWEKTSLSYTYRIADLNNIYQRANRFALKDYLLQQHAVEVKTDLFQARAFLTSENTGNSYNLRSAAENLDRKFKADDKWFGDFTLGFNNSITAPGTTTAQALDIARQQADKGRLAPGSAEFQNSLSELSQINNWDQGAALKVKDDLLHGEVQFDLAKAIDKDFFWSAKMDLLAGADYTAYLISPDGNYFINPEAGKTFERFSYAKTGGFLQAGKTLLGGLLKLSATLRADRSDYFSTRFNPRFSMVVLPEDWQSFRVSYQSGSRFPSIFEAFSNVNSGGVKRVGGLKVMSNGVFENAYLRSSIDRFQGAVKNDFNSGTMTTAQAIEKEKGLLVKNYYSYVKPEHINSIELGYKGFFLARTLKLDADFYYNKYKNFIAQVEMNVPSTGKVDSIPYYLNNKNLQSRYRLYTNSSSVVYNYGGSIGLSYLIGKKYSVGGNLSYAKLSRKDNNDGFEDGFNTPEWTANVSLSGEHIFKKAGFNISYKHQSGFFWQSFLANGNVSAYGTLDAQVNYDITMLNLNIKAGATNALNKYYYSYIGGPSVGGFYHTTLTFSIK